MRKISSKSNRWKTYIRRVSVCCIFAALLYGYSLASRLFVNADESPVVEKIADLKEESEEAGAFSLAEVPPYCGESYVMINENVPYFTSTDIEEAKNSYECYSDLDSLGRCGVCVASIGKDIMPTKERGEIGSVRPSGWHTVKYNGIIDGNYLYNRCHLIGYQLAGEEANTKNLITGTRYLNVEGMLPFENMVADYVLETGNHVLYRVTPVFEGENLLVIGVLMEAESVEDDGKGIQFNVFCYNVQPGIFIDYSDGDSETDGTFAAGEKTAPAKEDISDGMGTGAYAVNGKNGKIHIVGACTATQTGDKAMKQPVYFSTYEEAENYSKKIEPELERRKCGNCW